MEKEYDSRSLDKELQDVSLLNRKSFLAPKNKDMVNNNKFEWSFLTTFSSQCWWVNKIIRKHWQVLKSDKILGPKLPDKPNVVEEIKL